ncbi:MAG: ABC transporter ATP-binding protein [Alicyclobacillus herbarius]|uniref:ABC transporter ATP-binding protein n=1 Tax=Alicyclobacillus herbarius TaxID=122960 RepID=UPI00235615AC|nr:ABC transporter ATP-binding protein [Alicyclobacillus herbarius]MCL6632292.1 ABC transporter ATP-binding protein [Alicyclobacillus herbarius]
MSEHSKTPAHGDYALEVEGVCKSLGGRRVLQDITFAVPKGQFLVVVGPSGCGKSTLLNLVAGFEQPDDGVIKMHGDCVSSASHLVPVRKRDIGMIFQKFALWPHMTVYENVEFPLRNKFPNECRRRDWAKKQVMVCLELVGLEHEVHKLPHQLSGGQQQRVALARALVTKPAILLMDEPLSSLDAELRERLAMEIRRLQLALKSTVLYVTHDQREAMTLADRVVVLNQGRIEQTGTPEDVYLHPKTPFVAQFVSRGNLLDSALAREIARAQNTTLITEESRVAVLRERIRLKPVESPTRVEHHGVMAHIVTRHFLGTGFEYAVELAAGGVLVVHTGEQFDVGQHVSVEVDAFQTFDEAPPVESIRLAR